MALKYKITKKAHAALAEDLQIEYKAEGNSFVLDVEGLPELDEDTGALKRANDRLKADLDEAKEDLKTTKSELDTLKKGQTDGDKDVAKLTAQHEKREKKIKDDADAKIASLRDKIKTKMIDAAVEKMAGEISTAPKLMHGPLRERFTVEFDDEDNATLKVLKDGKPSDMTTDKLAEEFRANKDYASVIKASQASGGGTTSKSVQSDVGGGAGQDQTKPIDLGTAKPAELLAHMRQKMSNQGATQ
jgi:hypothetical protein